MKTLVTVLVAVTAGAGAGAVTAQLAAPPPVDAASDAALLRRIDQHIGNGDSSAGTGLWRQIWSQRKEQAEFCRAVAANAELCPSPTN